MLELCDDAFFPGKNFVLLDGLETEHLGRISVQTWGRARWGLTVIPGITLSIWGLTGEAWYSIPGVCKNKKQKHNIIYNEIEQKQDLWTMMKHVHLLMYIQYM